MLPAHSHPCKCHLITLCSFIVILILTSSVTLFAEDVIWLNEVNTEQELNLLSVVDTSRADLLRSTKFLAPALEDPALLQTVYQNVNVHPLHLEFMITVFPDRFAGLTTEEYMNLIFSDSKTYFAGSIFQFQDRSAKTVYGFNLYDSPSRVTDPTEIKVIYERLLKTFRLRPFAYSPITPAEMEPARKWANPGFPVYLPEGLTEPEYEAYSLQCNYGRVRRFTADQLNQAVQNGIIGWQDIVVVDAAPSDIETVVAGIVTGTRQGELSHVNVRSLRRGTPNAYIRNALQVFEPYEGQLVKVTFTKEKYEIIFPVRLDEAEEWWKKQRLSIPPLRQPDDGFANLLALPQLVQPENPLDSITRFGGKASQLGLLYSAFLSPSDQQDIPFLVGGYAIPFHYYTQFMQNNRIPHPFDSMQAINYDEYIRILLAHERFRSDTAYRHRLLDEFVEYMRDHGETDSALLQAIVEKTKEVFGSTLVKLRFRSSSNAEDSLTFNGAGLYDSTSVCVEDSLDGDSEGPCLCDSLEPNKRTIERGLKKVWASLWKPTAFEEREYYQIDHTQVRMGVLVTRAYPHEDCNGVAFTGDPATGRRDYYLVNVQKGDDSVVQPGMGVTPEKDLLYLKHDFVEEIGRARKSSLMSEGEWVLSDEQLFELGSRLGEIERMMPVDTQGYPRDQILFDVEFKFQDGQLVIKQIRPTLAATVNHPHVRPEKVTVSIPVNTYLAKVYDMSRSIEQENRLLSLIQFKAGEYALPTESGTYDMNWIDRVEIDSEPITVTSQGPGQLTVEAYDKPENGVILRYRYQEIFQLDAIRMLFVSIEGLQILNENQTQYRVRMDRPFLLENLSVTGRLTLSGLEYFLEYGADRDDAAQINQHELILENGQSIRLYEQIKRNVHAMGIAFANLACGDVCLDHTTLRQTSYWKLVYTAMGHCWNAKFWIKFDQPIGDAYGVAVLTTTLEWGLKTEAEVFLLDKNYQHLRPLKIVSYEKTEVDRIPEPFTNVNDWMMR